jgi:hypothetical protein
MISVLASSAVDRRFDPRSGQTKTVKLVFVASQLSMQDQGERAKTGWLGIRIMCRSGVTCLSTDCCFSELALLNPTKHVGPVQSRHHHHFIEN